MQMSMDVRRDIDRAPLSDIVPVKSKDRISAFGPVFVELVIVASMMTGYRWVRTLSSSTLVDAFGNARNVVEIEIRLGLAIEADIQRWILGRPVLVHLMNQYYVWMHFPVAVALLVWVYWRHRGHYSVLRNELIAVTLTGLIVHIVFPLAPPRMMPGFVDTLTDFGPKIYPESALDGAANQVAAMPSLHFAWAVVASVWVIRLSTSRLRHLALNHPILMLASIIGTANHWWLDAACAAVIYAIVRITAAMAGAVITRRQPPCVERC